jgi:hypothetical protein
MKKNIGSTDRIARTSIAATLLILYVLNVITGAWGIAAMVFSAVLLLTGAISFCPVYLPLGLNTIRNTPSKKIEKKI